MRQLFTLLFLLTMLVGCGDTAQQRQTVQAKQVAATKANLKAIGEAMRKEHMHKEESDGTMEDATTE